VYAEAHGAMDEARAAWDYGFGGGGAALTSATLAKIRKNGVNTATSFAVAPGSYRVREVIREAAGNRIWASAALIEIR
jgi:hypothetical protein